MKKKTLIILISAIAAILILIAGTTSYAWFSRLNSFEPALDKATIVKQYFHTGTGTAEDPFVITRPVHFYNLVELYQRKDGFADADYHFKLGYDLDGSGVDKFYNYDDLGKQIKTAGNEYTTELNLQFYSGANALLPIGTSDVPFDATFSGSDLTVKNIHIKAAETVNGSTYGSSDVGIWGYVGEHASISNVYFSNVTIDLSNTDALRTTSDHNSTVHDGNEDGTPELIYVGYIAGHVHTSSTIQNVYINDCTITGGDAAVSGYGYFGCVENGSGELTQTLGAQIATLRTRGEDAGFGGSINMNAIFNRLNGMIGSTATTVRNVTSEEVRIDEVNGTETVSNVVYATGNAQADGNTVYYYANEHDYAGDTLVDGSYYMFRRSSSGSWTAIYLYGENSRTNTKEVTTYTLKDEFSDAFYIRDGSDYLSVSGTAVSASATQGGAAKWLFDDAGHLYTMIETSTAIVPYYLNRSGTSGVTLTTSADTVWSYTPSGSDTFASELYTEYNSVNYYLDKDTDWRLTPIGTYYRIDDGSGHYLSGTASGVSSETVEANALKWRLSDPSGSTTTVSAYINGTEYFLTCDGTLSMSTTPQTWTKDGSKYYTTVQGVNYYLVYDTSWKALPATGSKITDGSGHYLTATASSVGNDSLADSAIWQFSTDTGDTQIFTVINGQKYYLTYNSGLTVSTTAATWHRSGSSLYLTTPDGKDRYLTYSGEWTVMTLEYFTIHDDAGNYLRVTGANAFANGNAGNATHFYFTNENGVNSSGRAYCVVNGTTYYLYNNSGNLGTATTPATGTEWQNDGSSLYVTSGNATYSIQYDTGWKLKTIYNGYYITDGTNYMTVSGTTIGNTTDPDQATVFIFGTAGGNPGGTVAVAGTNYYLRNNNGTLQVSTTSTSWSNDGSNLYNGNYYLFFLDGAWKLSPKTYYLLKSGNYYMTNTSGTSLGASTSSANAVHWENTSGNIKQVGTNYYLYSAQSNNSTVSLSTTSANWTSSGGKLYQSGIIRSYYLRLVNNNSWQVNRTQSNGSNITFETVTLTQESRAAASDTTRPTVRLSAETDSAPTLTLTPSGSAGMTLTLTGPSTEELTFEKTTYQSMTKVVTTEDSGYPTYFPLRVPKSYDDDYDANDLLKPSNKNTGYIVSGGNFYDGSTSGTKVGDIRVSEYAVSNISGSYSTTGLSVSTLGYNGNYMIVEKNASDEYVISNTTDRTKATFFEYTSDNRLRTLVRTTYYYLTYDNGLALSTSPGVAWTFNSNNNRLSYNNNYIQYSNNQWRTATTTQNLTLTLGTLGTIYTYDDSGNHALTDAQKTEVYELAAVQFAETIVGQSNVYGLHFMNSEISTDNLVKAEYANILAQEFTDYELPEDSIDFTVIERGSINFFAGEYFNNNNAFFSLHKVFRYTANDAEVINGTKKVGDIKMIKEIAEVYKDSTLGDRAEYIYKFKEDGGTFTYSNADGSYDGATTLASGYVSAFKLSWITAPSGLSTSNNRIYYFEIPCNEGEYCLGSVEGKTGAYLLYLDIAANGGDAIASAISSDANEIIESFNVEFRSSPDTENSTILQFSIEAPGYVSASDFSVNVTFDGTATASPHTSGLYTVTVVNHSTEDVNLFVYLCDDDFNPLTQFTYAYRVVYTNATNNAVTLTTLYGTELQVVAGFVIPATGEASEATYH